MIAKLTATSWLPSTARADPARHEGAIVHPLKFAVTDPVGKVRADLATTSAWLATEVSPAVAAVREWLGGAAPVAAKTATVLGLIAAVELSNASGAWAGSALGQTVPSGEPLAAVEPSPPPAEQGHTQIHLPQHYQELQKVLSLTTRFELRDDTGHEVGEVDARLFSLARQLDLKDGAGAVVATARQKIWSWGSQVDITDPAGNHVATISERVDETFKSLGLRTVYSITNAKGELVATSVMQRGWGTQDTVTDRSGQPQAEMTRPFFAWRQEWTIRQSDEVFDASIPAFIAAMKSEADLQSASSSSSSHHHSSHHH